MIALNGTIQRRFLFPADMLTTLLFFSDLNRVAFHLPHIVVVDSYETNQVRIRYQTVELGAYTINIYCDLGLEVDVDQTVINVFPLEGQKVVSSSATLNATTGYGYFSSVARFFSESKGTGIDFKLKFESKLPRPRGLKMMPKRVVDRIAHSISIGRVEEIAEGFMESARHSIDGWLAEQEPNAAEKWLASRGNKVK